MNYKGTFVVVGLCACRRSHFSCILFVTQSTGWEVGGSCSSLLGLSCLLLVVYHSLFFFLHFGLLAVGDLSLPLLRHIHTHTSINTCRQCRLSAPQPPAPQTRPPPPLTSGTLTCTGQAKPPSIGMEEGGSCS